MHPFHLCNVMRKQKLSKRACLKLFKRVGDDLAGLFILAMADSLAGQGKLKPAGMEKNLAVLLNTVITVYNENIHPILSKPRLLTGHDLIKVFNMVPGPLFSKIFDQLEIARVEGDVGSKEEALNWVGNYLQKKQQW